MRLGVVDAHFLHGGQNGLAHTGVAQVAREHGGAAFQHAARAQAVQHVLHMGGGEDLALEFAITGVVGELHGVHCDRFYAQQLQRQHGGVIAHMAVGDVRLNAQNQRRLLVRMVLLVVGHGNSFKQWLGQGGRTIKK